MNQILGTDRSLKLGKVLHKLMWRLETLLHNLLAKYSMDAAIQRCFDDLKLDALDGQSEAFCLPRVVYVEVAKILKVRMPTWLCDPANAETLTAWESRLAAVHSTAEKKLLENEIDAALNDSVLCCLKPSPDPVSADTIWRFMFTVTCVGAAAADKGSWKRKPLSAPPLLFQCVEELVALAHEKGEIAYSQMQNTCTTFQRQTGDVAIFVRAFLDEVRKSVDEAELGRLLTCQDPRLFQLLEAILTSCEHNLKALCGEIRESMKNTPVGFAAEVL